LNTSLSVKKMANLAVAPFQLLVEFLRYQLLVGFFSSLIGTDDPAASVVYLSLT